MSMQQAGSSKRTGYLHVADRICRFIHSGQLGAMDQIPTEAQMAEEIGVNPLTVSRGYGVLRQRGIITQKRGRGSFVSPQAERLLGLPPRRRLRNVAVILRTDRLANIPSHYQFIVLGVLFGVTARFEGLAVNVCSVPVFGCDQVLDRHWVERFDAFLLLDHSPVACELVRMAHEAERPCIHLNASDSLPGEFSDVPSITHDRRAAVRLGVDHLVSRGYRRIGFLGEMSCGRGRAGKFDAYVDGMQAHGLEVEESWLLPASARIGSACEAVHRLLAGRGPLPQAFFVDTDYKALEAMQMLSIAGIRVPEQIAVCGYDDIADARSWKPALTTVYTPLHEIGYQAGDMLLNWLPASPRPKDLMLPAKLIARDTTPPIDGGSM